MKKLLRYTSILVLFAFLISYFQVLTNAEIIEKIKYKNFIVTGFSENSRLSGEITIVNYVGNKTNVVIPAKIKGQKITAVDLSKNCKLKKIKISKYIKKVSVSKAQDLKKASVSKKNKYFTVKNNLVLNKKGTILKSCPGGLKTVNIPKKVKTIAESAFYKSNVAEIRFNNNIKNIKSHAFYNCKKLKKVDLSNVEQIGIGAFSGCSSLKETVISESVKRIERNAFKNCKNFESIYFYNKDCIIGSEVYFESMIDWETVPRYTAIYGYEKSTAETYALTYGNEFVVLK